MTGWKELLLAHVTQMKLITVNLIDECPHFSVEDLQTTDLWLDKLSNEIYEMQRAVWEEMEVRIKE